jgi:hypothetical protein
MSKEFSRGKLVLHAIIILISSVIAGVILLCLAYMLPTERMKANVAAAYDLFMDERVYHDWSNDVEYTRLDGYTDMLMYGTAIYPGEEDVLNEALLSRHTDMWYEDGMDVAYWSTDQPGEYRPITYEVYWHGYLIWLKPLLLFMHPRNIRVLNMMVQAVLIAYLLHLYSLKFKGKYLIPLVAGLIIINTVSTAMCLQFSSILYISVIAMILIMKYPKLTEGRHNFSLFFLMIGICVAYFDFLTYPPIALVFPLLVYLTMRGEGILPAYAGDKATGSGLEDVFCQESMPLSVMRAGIYWSVGYIGMWASKWVLPIIVGDNRLDYVLYELGYRSGMDDVTFAQVLTEKLKVLMIKPFILMFGIYIIYVLIRYVISCRNKQLIARGAGYIVSVVMVVIIPIAWYFVVREHSLHAFAYKELAGTIMAAMVLIELFLPNVYNKNFIEWELR